MTVFSVSDKFCAFKLQKASISDGREMITIAI